MKEGLVAVFAARRNEAFSAAPKAIALREARTGDTQSRVRPHELLDQLVATQVEGATPEPVVRRYPGYVRVAVPIVGSAMLWAGIIWAARAVF